MRWPYPPPGPRAALMQPFRYSGKFGHRPQAPWDTFSGEELLDQLPKVARAGDDVENHLKNWVGAARP